MKFSFSGIILLLLFLPAKSLSQKFTSDTLAAQALFHQALHLQKTAKYDSALILLDSSGAMFAKAGKRTEQVRCLINKAECLKYKSNFDKAIDALQLGAEMEQQLLHDAPLIAAQRFVMLGSIFREQAKYDTALIDAESAFSIQRNNSVKSKDLEWDIYTLFAGTYFSLGENDSALSYNRRALELFTLPEGEQLLKISGTYNSIAGVYEIRGDYQKALDFYTQSLTIRKSLLGEKHPDIANLYNNIAAIYFRMADYDLSLEYYFKSLSIMNETLQSDHASFGNRYNNIAMAYRGKKEYDKALQFGLQSKTIFVKKLGAKHPNVGGVVNNIGRTYSDMKEYQRALDSYQEALSIWKEKLGEKHPIVSQSYYNIGEAYGNLKDFEKAKEWIERSLSVRLEILGEKNVKVAQSYNALGKLYFERGTFDSALQNYHKAISALIEGMPDSISSIVKSSSDPDLVLSIIGKADVLFAEGRTQQNFNDVRAALIAYEQAIDLTDKIRRGFGTEGAKIQLSQMSFNVYEQAIASALFLFDQTKDESYISKAFSFAERSKAGILLDAVSESNAKQFGGIPDSLLEQESAFRTELTYYETLLQKEKEKKGKANKVKIVQCENKIFDLKRGNEQLVKRFEREYPKYYSLKHQSEVVSLADIQRRLPDTKSALLEYVVGDTTVTIFAVTKKGCIVKSQRLSILTSLVQQFRQSIQNVESNEYAVLANSLYRQLITPVQSRLKGIQKLYVVPDGILNHLPFEALLTTRINSSAIVDFSTLPYLIRQFDISYQISARSLLEYVDDISTKGLTVEEKKTTYEFIGIAPVFADKPSHSEAIYTISAERITRSRSVDGERFVELKESEHEVTSIFKLFEEHQKSGKMYLHNSATESSLKSDDMKKSRFIHIATHGIINEENPKLSGVIFAVPEKGTMDDGVLYSGEIYNLQLNADLVTLSACETGLGTIVKGEGLLGLTRGFMYAGAKNLLVSLWQVADKSTAELMMQFYRNILNNQPYSTALRNAKLAMIKKGKYAHPVEWSPFILTGK